MKLPRRTFLNLAAGAAALSPVSRVARAQLYPSRPVRIIVTFPAGGANDFHARLIGQWLSERLGQSFVVENRAGSGGNVGVAEVVRAQPDGYTLLLLTVSHAINSSFYPNLTFDLLRDIAPIAPFYRSTYVMLVNPSLPVKTVPEFVAFARANVGKVNMGSNGIGATGHLAGEMFKMMTGVEMLHVPYRGEAPALTDLIGGQLHVQFASLAASNELIKGGQLRALAVTAGARWRGLPDVPAMNEFVPGYEVSTWAGMGAPRDTPASIIDRLNKEINAGLTSPQIQAKYADLGTILTISPAEFRELLADDIAKWARVIRTANIKAE